MPVKAKPKPRPKNYRKLSQKQRFLEAARKAEADESGETFERAFRKVISSGRARRSVRENGA